MVDRVQLTFLDAPIPASTGLESWVASIKSKIGNQILSHLQSNTDHLDRYIEVVQIAEIPGAYMCCSFYPRDIID
jgi:hypothetical protein